MKIKLNCEKEKYVELQKHFYKEDFDIITKNQFINQKIYRIEYINAVSCFDSETSKINLGDEEKEEWYGWVYQWCMCVSEQFVGGRTISQFLQELDRLKRLYKLRKNKRHMIIYIHNLSYDAVYFLREMHRRDIDIELFMLDARKILTIKYDCFEIRDSYRLSNMSLEKWCEQLHTTIKKAVGAIDYNIIRYQDDNLIYNDWFYQVNDVASMKECIEIELRENNDTLLTIPLTSTGYVRRDCRNAVKNDASYRKFFERTALTEQLYSKMYMAFAGGYCHANRHILNTTVCGCIGHDDKKSFYPSTQQMGYFPVSKFSHLYEHKEGEPFLHSTDFASYLATQCCLVQIVVINPTLKKEVTAPYLQFSKLRGKHSKLKLDNGRVLAYQGAMAMYCTELDLDIIERQYKADIYITDVYVADRGEFPIQFKKVIHKYFEVKETLKKDGGYFYMKSKNKLNAIFGMSCSRLIRDDIEHDFDLSKDKVIKIIDKKEREKKIKKYYNSRNSFFPYQLGVWLTAQCRHELFYLIELIGYDKFLYSDTDSIFYMKDEETERKLKEYNEGIKRQNDKLGITLVKKDGTKSYYNLFEDEKDNIVKFRTLHSKCYAFEDAYGGLHCTIAGISKDNKKDGVSYLTNAEELGAIDNLDNEFTFYECGGTISKYVSRETMIININGHITELSDACIILNHEKTISSISQCDFDDMYDYADI